MNRIKILQFLFLLCLFQLIIHQAYSQCDPDLSVQPAVGPNGCAIAFNNAQNSGTGSSVGFVCNLDGFCINTQDQQNVPTLSPPQTFNCNGGYALHNPIWFSFYASGTTLDIDIISSECPGQGFQWILLDQCGDLNNSIACQGDPVPPNTSTNINVTTIPGEIYMLVIDGASGAVCHYEFQVNQGIAPVFVGEPLGTALTGNVNFCPAQTIQYSFAGFEYATDYEWTLPTGATVETASPNVTVNFPENMAPGTYELCVVGKNDCDDNLDAEPLCWTITIMEEEEFFVTGEVCEDEQFFYRGNSYGPGSYDIIAPGPGMTSCDTTYHLTVNQKPNFQNPNGGTAYKCPTDPVAFIEGIPCGGGPAGCPYTYEASNGCDSVVTYFIVDFEATGQVVASPAAIPCGGGGTSTLFLLDLDWNAPPSSSLVVWYDEDGNTIATGVDQINVNAPGVYTVSVTSYIYNPIWAGGNQVACETVFEVIVGAEDSVLEEPVPAGPQTLCAGQSYTFNVDHQDAADEYNWDPAGGNVTGADNGETIVLTFDDPGSYTITVNALDGCGPGPEATYDILVVPSPVADLPADYAICNFGDDLTATISGVTDIDDPLMFYQWTCIAGPDPAGVTFSPANSYNTDVSVPVAGIYTFVFGADYNGQNCGNTDTIVVTFEEKLILTPIDSVACNAAGQPNANIIDLSGLLSDNGIPYTGTWTMVSGPGAPVFNAPSVDFTDITQTGVYVFEFTPNMSGVCAVDPVQVSIQLNNCICPPLVIEPNGGTFCNDDGSVALNGLVLGSTGSGQWVVGSQPGGGSVSIVGNTVSFSGQPAGSYVFDFTLDNSMPGCPTDASSTVTLVAAPQATLKPASSACNSNFSAEYIYLVDFDTLITNGPTTGVWSYNGAGADPANGNFHPADFNGATPGSYEYKYTLTGDPSCDPVEYFITIVVEDCKCPSRAISPENSLCNDNATFDLDDYTVTTRPGEWSVESGPAGHNATINQANNEFNANGSPFGTYILVFTLTVPNLPAECIDTSQLILVLDSVPSAGQSVSEELCDGEASSLDLDNILSGQQSGGSWAYTGSVNIGSSFNPASANLDFDNIPDGSFTFNYTVLSPLGLCPDNTATVTIVKNPLPVADAGSDAILTCDDPATTLDGSASSSGGDYSYVWTNTDDNSVAGNSATVANISTPGTYSLEVTNNLTGCSSSDLVVISTDNAVISDVEYSVDSITCFNRTDGNIQILNVLGGTPDFQYSINGGPLTSNPDFASLAAGNYTIRIVDRNGCWTERTITLINPPQLTVDLGNDLVIPEGDTVTITPDYSIGNTSGLDITWITNGDPVACPTCPIISDNPVFTTTYTITITDANGCSTTDDVTVTVRSTIRVFIPNSISPNDDGINDMFYIHADHNVVKINKVAIYNRWGDVQYTAENILPNDPTTGWDGRFNKQDNYPAVFVYFAELELRDGRTEIYKGNLTVIR